MSDLVEHAKTGNLLGLRACLASGAITAAELTDAAIAALNAVQPEPLSVLLEAGANPSAKLPGHGWSLLHLAVEQDDIDGVRLLLQHGADVNAGDMNGVTPLHHAVDFEADTAHQTGRSRPPRVIRLLLEAGADPSAKDHTGQTPIDVAQDYSYDEAVQLMAMFAASRTSTSNPHNSQHGGVREAKPGGGEDE
jgi:ankyrin repeat protein